MNRPLWIACLLILTVVYATPPASHAVSEEPAIDEIPAATAPRSIEEAAATLVANDLGGFVDRVANLAESIVPSLDTKQLRTQGEMALGSPGLFSATQRIGLAVVVFPEGEAVLLADVPDSVRGAFGATLKMFGARSDMAENLVLMATNNRCLEIGKQLASQVKSRFFGQPPEPVLRISLHPNRTLSQHDEEIQEMLKALPDLMNEARSSQADAGIPMATAGFDRLVEAELRVLLSLARQVDSLELALAPGSEGLEIGVGVTATPKSNLDDFFSAPHDSKGLEILKFAPGTGSVRAVACFESKAIGDLLQKEMLSLFDRMEFPGTDPDALMNWTRELMGVFGGSFAMDLFTPGGSLLNGTYLYRIEDPEAALEMFRTMQQKMEATGIAAFYASLGMPMDLTFKENVRQHKGIPIHQMTFHMEMKGMPPNEAKMLGRLFENLNYELAIVDHHMGYTMGGDSVEDLIDGMLAGAHPDSKPLAAGGRFGPGANLYADLGLSGYLRFLSEIAVENLPKAGIEDPLKKMQATFDGAEPILGAAFLAPGESNLKLFVPVDLMKRISEAVRNLETAGG